MLPTIPRGEKEFAFPSLHVVGVSSEEVFLISRLEVQPPLIWFRVIIEKKYIPKLAEGHIIFIHSPQRHCTSNTSPCIGDELSRANIIKY